MGRYLLFPWMSNGSWARRKSNFTPETTTSYTSQPYHNRGSIIIVKRIGCGCSFFKRYNYWW
ncbi:hypothetical protein MICAG_840004 [Microcystis aeruginosa PCC 9808]|uniref:Uncharacterized protein n=1 Tax=Microcystis aeruginosa PCC 9808 TaxID=1160284 RepID=I4I5A8_MICAE|nr:hypothetical protein MICAG_840004 [Microcystis aeruginosa PCC 9808]